MQSKECNKEIKYMKIKNTEAFRKQRAKPSKIKADPVNQTVRTASTTGWLDKIDQTYFLDQTDYLIGKLPDQTEVQIRTRIRPDSKTYHDQHITFVYNWQTKCHQLTSGAVFRHVVVPKDDILNI